MLKGPGLLLGSDPKCPKLSWLFKKDWIPDNNKIPFYQVLLYLTDSDLIITEKISVLDLGR